MKIISISGKAGSGKDVAYQLMAEYLSSIGKTHTRISFAGPLKDHLATMFNWDRDRLDYDATYKEGNTLDDGSPDPACEMLGMCRREAMQLYGTDAVRNNLHPDTWIIAAKIAMANGKFGDYDYGFITDCRFLNELEFTQSMGGTSLQIQRMDGNSTLTDHSAHSSETEWQEWTQWSSIVENNGLRTDQKTSLKTFQTALVAAIIKDDA